MVVIDGFRKKGREGKDSMGGLQERKERKKKKKIYLFDISNLNVLCQNWKEGEGSFGVS